MLNLTQTKEYARKILTTKWVRWYHAYLPQAHTALAKEINAILGDITNHCARCRNLNGCCFVINKCPPWPLHKNCHCKLIDVNPPAIKAECAIEKFKKYIFHPINNREKTVV